MYHLLILQKHILVHAQKHFIFTRISKFKLPISLIKLIYFLLNFTPITLLQRGTQTFHSLPSISLISSLVASNVSTTEDIKIL